MPKPVRSSRRGFTLIELILVMLLVAVIIGIISPNLRGFSKGAKLRDVSEQFLTLTRLARVQAISTGQVHRLTVELTNNGGRCFVEAENAQQAPAGGLHDGSFDIPEGVSVQVTDLSGQARQFLEFYPSGRTQTAKVRVSMIDGDGNVLIQCVAPIEGFATVPQ